MTDLNSKFNDTNLQLKNSDKNLIKAKSVICTFIAKFSVFKQNIDYRDLFQFPNMKQLEKDGYSLQNNDLLIFVTI